jgi:outer membrane receptor protein involved in Fe transport
MNFGADIFGGRGRALVSLAHSEQDPVYSQQSRPWGRQGYGLLTIPGNVPLNLILPNVNQIATYGGLIPSGPLANTQFLAGGLTGPYNPGGLKSSVNTVGGDAARNYSNLSSKVRTDNVFAHAEFDATPKLTLFIEGSFGETRNRYAQTYPFQFGATPFTIFSGNPFLPAQLQTQMTAQGIASFPLARISKDFGFAVGDFLNDSDNIVVGGKGKFGAGWSYDFYYEHGDTRVSTHTDGNPIQENLYAAADAVMDPASGKAVCRVSLTNPGRYPGCVPINLFGAGSPSQAAINYVTGASYYRPTLTQDVASFSLRGEPFSTWAGPVALGGGVEYRRESVNQVSDTISQMVKTAPGIRGFPTALLNTIGGYSLTNQQPISGSYDIREGFVETLVPLAKDAPWAKSLDLNAAVRYTDYSTSGGVTTWKVGLSYQPVEDLRIRGTVSEDIRAANLSELFAANIQGQGSVSDTQNAGRLVTIFTTAQGNTALRPEEARTYTTGFVYQPSWFSGFNLSVDYYNISINGAIQTLSAQQTVDQCAAGASIACVNIVRGTDGNIQRVSLPFLNFASLETSGVDIEGRFSRPLSDFKDGLGGTISLRGFATYVQKFETQVPGAAPVDHAGEVGQQSGANPRWQALVSGTYTNGPLTLFLQERYIAKGTFDVTKVVGVTINTNDVPERFYTDITAQRRFTAWGTDLAAFVTINNLFNRAPPLFPTVATTVWKQTNDSLYDVLGRYYTVGLRYQF